MLYNDEICSLTLKDYTEQDHLHKPSSNGALHV